jgi:hypothetical protein
LEAPEQWPAERRELFSTSTPEVQQLLLDVHKDMESGLSKKMEELAEQRKRLEGFDSFIDVQSSLYSMDRERFKGALLQALPNFLSTYAKLQRDPVGTLRELSDFYNVNDKLSEALLGQDNDESSRQRRLGESTKDVEIQRLRAEKADIDLRRANEVIDTFRSAKDPQGKLLHEYFDDLQPEIAKLISADTSLTLDRAYEKAMRSEKFDALVKAELDKDRESRDAERRKKVASLRKTTKPTPGRSNGSGLPTEKPKSLRDTISEGWDEQLNR